MPWASSTFGGNLSLVVLEYILTMFVAAAADQPLKFTSKSFMKTLDCHLRVSQTACRELFRYGTESGPNSLNRAMFQFEISILKWTEDQ